MKLNKLFSMLMLATALAGGFSACRKVPPVDPPTPPKPDDTTKVDVDTISVAQAYAICQTAATTPSETRYIIKGKVSNPKMDMVYKNANFRMYDLTDGTTYIDCKKIFSFNKATFVDNRQLKAGDIVYINARLVKYGKTYEYETTANKAYLIKSSNTFVPTTEPVGKGTYADPYTAEDVLILANGLKGNFYAKGLLAGSSTNSLNISFTTNPDSCQASNVLLRDQNRLGYVAVQLGSSGDAAKVRAGINLKDNNGLIGQEVLLFGSLETYLKGTGIKTVTYAEVDTFKYGKQGNATEFFFHEGLTNKTSFSHFYALNIKGDSVWNFGGMPSFSYDENVHCTGYNSADSKTYAQEDWLISNPIDLSGKSKVILNFNFRRGPGVNFAVTNMHEVYVIKNMAANDSLSFAAADTLRLTYANTEANSVTKWEWTSSGDIEIPSTYLTNDCRIAFKYSCEDNGNSAMWMINSVVLR